MPRRARTAAALIVVVALLALLPFVGGDYYIYLFALVFINVILAASLRPSLSCGQLNIGHSAFMCIGAYTSALLAKDLGVPFELSLLGGAVLAAAVGLGIGYPSLRLRGVYFAMVTVAFVEAVRLIASIWVPLTRGNAGLSGVPKPSLLGMTLATKTSQYYLGLVLMLVVLVILGSWSEAASGSSGRALAWPIISRSRSASTSPTTNCWPSRSAASSPAWPARSTRTSSAFSSRRSSAFCSPRTSSSTTSSAVGATSRARSSGPSSCRSSPNPSGAALTRPSSTRS